MTASILKQDPNTKRFKRMIIYFDMDKACIGHDIWSCLCQNQDLEVAKNMTVSAAIFCLAVSRISNVMKKASMCGKK